MPIPPRRASYWAFQKPVQAPLPVGSPADTQSIAFSKRPAGSRHSSRRRAPIRITLVRRAYLDLIGLPPTPAEVAAFVADKSPNAWEKLIDRLLASPHYGERWGRHWLDVARYADSSGFEHDFDRPNAWRYRDYVIRSFNRDKPYNDFLREQIAGDEIDRVTHDSLDRHRVPAQLRQGRFPREGQPGAPLRVSRRHDRHDRPRHSGTHGPVRALPQPQVRSHSRRRTTTRMQASLFGYVEIDYPLTIAGGSAQLTKQKLATVTARIDEVRR